MSRYAKAIAAFAGAFVVLALRHYLGVEDGTDGMFQQFFTDGVSALGVALTVAVGPANA